MFRHHSDFVDTGLPVYIGVSDPVLRSDIAFELGVHDEPWFHPRSFIGPDCTFGYGVHVNYGASLTRAVLAHHVTVAPGATICGDVVIGNRVLVGAGATLCEKVTVGFGARIGAGAVVLPGTTVPPLETWVGVPARRAG